MLNLNSATTGKTVNTLNLSKVASGDVINLSKSAPSLKNAIVKIVWGGEDLDLSIAQMSGGQFVRPSDPRSLVFYQNLSAQGISHYGDIRTGGTEEATITLGDVDRNVDELLFVATCHAEANEPKVTFGQVNGAKAYIIDKDTNTALFEFDLGGAHHSSTAAEVVRFTRKGSEWEVVSLNKTVGSSQSGLIDIFNKYSDIKTEVN